PALDQELDVMTVAPGIDPEMTVDRHWNACFPPLLYRRADRFGLQSLRHPSKIVPESEQDKTGSEDRDPGERHGQKLRRGLAPRHQRAKDEHRRHQQIEPAEHEVVSHAPITSSS